MKNTMVIGASADPTRYSHQAVKNLTAQGHLVVALGNRPGFIDHTPIVVGSPMVEAVDTITLYLSQQHQKEYYNYILSLHPKRIIFNPGAENEELVALAESKGIQTLEACTLVLLSTHQY